MISTLAKYSIACVPSVKSLTIVGGYFKTEFSVVKERLFSSSSSESCDPVMVGFVGLGNMGLPMCLNLVSSKDHTSPELHVMAYDVNDSAVAEAEMGGVVPATSLADLRTSDCSIIITSLPNDSAVDHVYGELLQGDSAESMHILEGDPGDKKRTFIDCSTVSPSTSRRWHGKMARQGHAMLDAPVSGGVRGAQEGTLTFMVGCDSKKILDSSSEILAKMGSTVMHCGGPGTGSATKLCNNLALATQMIGICESMNLGEALGVDPVVLAKVLNSSTASCWSSRINNPHPRAAEALNQSPASNEYKGGFATKLMLKDLTLAVEAGNNARVSLPLGTSAKELYQLVAKRGLGDKDFGTMLEFLKGT